jgi:hypothetical protein
MGCLQGMEKEMKKFRNFESAREFAISLNLKGDNEWRVYCKSGNKPDDIPSSPEKTYKNVGYVNLGDWLGTGNTHWKKFRDFESAREFVRSLNLKNQKEWQEYSISGNKPEDIPSRPERTYKKEFKGYGDWLGTGIVSNQLKQYRPFLEAREFVRSLGFKSQKEWIEYTKSGNKPNDVPSFPNQVYKNKGWKSVGDFLGTGVVASIHKQYRPFLEAREFVRSLNLKNQKEWQEYCVSGNKPDDIPSNPTRTYKKEWKDWGYWFGTGNVASYNKKFRSFESAKKYMSLLHLKNSREFRLFLKSSEKPDDIPGTPHKVYKKEWKGMGDFLSTGNVRPGDKQYRSFEEAREFVRSLKLKNNTEWKDYCKSGEKPDDIPAAPWQVYKEWKKK